MSSWADWYVRASLLRLRQWIKDHFSSDLSTHTHTHTSTGRQKTDEEELANQNVFYLDLQSEAHYWSSLLFSRPKRWPKLEDVCWGETLVVCVVEGGWWWKENGEGGHRNLCGYAEWWVKGSGWEGVGSGLEKWEVRVGEKERETGWRVEWEGRWCIVAEWKGNVLLRGESGVLCAERESERERGYSRHWQKLKGLTMS